MPRNPQLELLKKQPKAYGGELLKTRKGRSTPRPLAERATMHLVLRSSKAVGDWSFRKPKNEKKISEVVKRFSERHGLKVVSMANVGNHLHFQIKLGSRFTYAPFIRAVTGAIAMAVTGRSRWTAPETKLRFWDYRPFTRVVQGYKGFLSLRDYISINQLEGFGVARLEARWMVQDSWVRPWKYCSS